MNLTPIFKLFSDETRLRVIMVLNKEELCVCQLCGVLDEPQPKISKILSKLRDMDLVSDRRSEKFVFYSINDGNKLMKGIIDLIQSDIESHLNLLEDQSRLAAKEQYVDKCVLKSQNEKT
jgi:ArsR family transcriptional regulator